MTLPGVVDRIFPAAYDKHLTLPKSAAWDTLSMGVSVSVSRTALCVDGEVVAKIVDGALLVEDLQGHEIPALRERIEPLREALAERERARGDEPEGVIVFFADVGTRQSTIIDLMYTANRAGFRAYALAVVADVPLLSPFTPGFNLEPPKFTRDGKPSFYRPRHEVIVTIEHDHVAIETLRRPMERLPFDHQNAKDAAALAKLAREYVSGADFDQRTAPVAIFVGFVDITLDRFVAVLSAVAGPECDFTARLDHDGKRCAFPRAIVEAGAP